MLALLLNYVRLQPGEALFLAAGNVHAYLRGVGVEIMANSDNVLRCALTPKHVDVDELLAITDFSELHDPCWRPGFTPVGNRYSPPVPDFDLLAVSTDDDPRDVLSQGGSILLCTDGRVDVEAEGAHRPPLVLTPGHAAFVVAGTTALLSGAGTVYVARPGRLDP